jgi:ABC-type anion transport system duplicated permease subunit
MDERPIPKAVKKRLNGWFTTFWIFTICHYLFGIGGVLASTIAASANDTNTTRIAGVIAAVCIAVIGFIKPDEKYRKNVIAWRLLDEKVNQYRYGIIEIKELITGMALAEKTLDQMERETGAQRP